MALASRLLARRRTLFIFLTFIKSDGFSLSLFLRSQTSARSFRLKVFCAKINVIDSVQNTVNP